MQKIILASKSPRRKEILERLGVEFEVKVSGFDEGQVKCNDPRELVEELALQKALSVAKGEDALVVGGDTVVYVDGEILGKASDEVGARKILNKLVGKRHQVITGVAIVNALTGERVVAHTTGQVEFRRVSDVEVNKYIANGLWKGFAGCYAIQGGAKSWVVEQSGSLSAIIGMPVELTAQLLEEMGVIVEVDPRALEEEIKSNGSLTK